MRPKEIASLLDQAEKHIEKIEYAQAETLASEVLSSRPERKDDEARALCVLGKCCCRTARYADALAHLHNALTAAEAASNLSLQARALNETARVQGMSGVYNDALRNGERALTLAQKAKDKKQQAYALNTIGAVHDELAEYTLALDYYARALALAEEIGDKILVSTSLTNIGLVHSRLSDYPRALDYYARALALDEEIGDKRGVSADLCNIGLVYKGLTDTPRALDYLSSAVALAEEIGEKVGIEINLGNMGLIYIDTGDYTRALECLKRSLDLSEEIGARSSVGYWMNGIATVEHKLGNLEAAYQGFTETLRFRREVLKSDDEVAYTLLALGGVLIEQGKTEEGLARLEESLALAEELGVKKAAAKAHKEIADAYAKKGDMAKAFDHLTKHLALDKEIFSDESKKSIEKFNMRVAIADEGREAAVQRLRAERSEHETEMQRLKAERIERDLSNSTLQLLAQTELLSELRSDLLQIVRKIPLTEPAAKELRDRLKNLPCKSVDWVKFDSQFAAAHPHFTKKLAQQHPDFSPTEVRICSLLRMNLKSEEIARLFCLSERSVEFHRYNIRKKLGLKKEQNLPIVLAAL